MEGARSARSVTTDTARKVGQPGRPSELLTAATSQAPPRLFLWADSAVRAELGRPGVPARL